MNVIGLKCCYIGWEPPMKGRRLTIMGVLRGRGRSGDVYLETDDEELEHEPVLPEEQVRVRMADTRDVIDARATDLDVFRHLAPRMMKLDVNLEESTTTFDRAAYGAMNIALENLALRHQLAVLGRTGVG